MNPHHKNIETSASGLAGILLQEKTYRLQEDASRRIIFRNGVCAKGRFSSRQSLQHYTEASIFGEAATDIIVRFSHMAHRGSTGAGVKGMAIKFIAGECSWDLVCSNIPVFALQDGHKFPQYLEAQTTTSGDTSAEWEFYGQNPETLHGLLMSLSNRAMDAGFAAMNAYSGNTYSFVSKDGTLHWVKFHLKSLNENVDELNELKWSGKMAQQLQWAVYAQIMSEEQAKDMAVNPFDATKVWFHADCPLNEIGEIILDEILDAEKVQNIAFSPSNMIKGIGLSPDPVLLARLAVYGGVQRRRLGGEYLTGSDFSTLEDAINILSEVEEHYRHYDASDPYFQAGLFYTKALKTDAERDGLAQNIIASMQQMRSEQRHDLVNRQLCHFFRANAELGVKVARGLRVDLDLSMLSHAKP